MVAMAHNKKEYIMATIVNASITDSVTEANTLNLAVAPGAITSNLMQVASQATGLSLQNAVSGQQQSTSLHEATSTQGPTVDDINEDVLKRGQEFALKSAFEVVSMAVATGLQNELAMHSSFETTSNTVLNLALTKMAEAAAIDDQPGIENWQK
ncbi:hypothetical protein AWC38_SpisGene25193, partial [Stylophora pistillata]